MAFEFGQALIDTTDSSIVSWADFNSYIKCNNKKLHKIIKGREYKKLAGMLDLEKNGGNAELTVKRVVSNILKSKTALITQDEMEQDVVMQLYFAVSRL